MRKTRIQSDTPATICSAFDRLADNWDERHGPRSPNAAIFMSVGEALAGTCRALGRPRVLDVGCGTGFHLIHISDLVADGIGVDLSAAMIAKARQNATGLRREQPLRFETAALENIAPARGGAFDLICFIGSLEHMLSPRDALTKARSLLGPGGHVFVVLRRPLDPATAQAALADISEDIPPVHHFTPTDLQRYARSAGLRLMSMSDLSCPDKVKVLSGSLPAALRARSMRSAKGIYTAVLEHQPTN